MDKLPSKSLHPSHSDGQLQQVAPTHQQQTRHTQSTPQETEKPSPGRIKRARFLAEWYMSSLGKDGTRQYMVPEKELTPRRKALVANFLQDRSAFNSAEKTFEAWQIHAGRLQKLDFQFKKFSYIVDNDDAVRAVPSSLNMTVELDMRKLALNTQKASDSEFAKIAEQILGKQQEKFHKILPMNYRYDAYTFVDQHSYGLDHNGKRPLTEEEKKLIAVGLSKYDDIELNRLENAKPTIVVLDMNHPPHRGVPGNRKKFTLPNGGTVAGYYNVTSEHPRTVVLRKKADKFALPGIATHEFAHFLDDLDGPEKGKTRPLRHAHLRSDVDPKLRALYKNYLKRIDQENNRKPWSVYATQNCHEYFAEGVRMCLSAPWSRRWLLERDPGLYHYVEKRLKQDDAMWIAHHHLAHALQGALAN